MKSSNASIGGKVVARPLTIRLMETARLWLSRFGLGNLIGTRLMWEMATLFRNSATYSVGWTTDQDEFERMGAADAEKLRAYLSPEFVVADLGAGVGRVAQHVAPLVRELWLIDISASMLRHAKRRLQGQTNVRFLRSNLTYLKGIPDETFHLVYSFRCLQHMEKEDSWLAIKEAARVTRPGGVVYLQVQNLASEGVWQGFQGYAEDKGKRSKARVRPHTESEVAILAKRAGLEVESISHDGYYIEALCRKNP